jgi:hypothetical protein
MMPVPHGPQQLTARHATRPARRWRPVDVAVLVAVACYGAAMLIVAAGLFARLVR